MTTETSHDNRVWVLRDGAIEPPAQVSRDERVAISSPMQAWKKMQDSGWSKSGGANVPAGGGIGLPGQSPLDGGDQFASLEKAAETLERGAEKIVETFGNAITIAIVGANG